MNMNFNIGDRVRVLEYKDIPEGIRHKGYGKNVGMEGEIVDILWSNYRESYVYRIQFDGCNEPSRTDFIEGSFELIPEEDKPAYSYEFEFLENMVVARLYETKGDSKTEIANGHGHIIHDGIIGLTQAASWAIKKVYETVNGGTIDHFKKGGYWHG